MGPAELIKKGYDLLTPHCEYARRYRSIQFYIRIKGKGKGRTLVRETRYRCWHMEPPWDTGQDTDTREPQTAPGPSDS